MNHWAASSLPTTTPAIPSLLLAAAVLVGDLLVLAAQEVRPGVAESSPAPVAMASDVECLPRQAWAAESSMRLVPWAVPAAPRARPTTPAELARKTVAVLQPALRRQAEEALGRTKVEPPP